MLAVIKTGGKQYIVQKGDKLKVEKIEGKEGEKVEFREILLKGDEKGVRVGKPFLSDVVVEGKILKQGKAKKVWGVKHKAKKRYKVKFGHRQPLTEIEVMKI